MSRLIETIRYEDGVFLNLPYHEQRMERAHQEVFGEPIKEKLKDRLHRATRAQVGCFKVRVLYDNKNSEVEFNNYKPRDVTSLKVVVDNTISYEYKWEDRRALIRIFENRGACDDVLIIKNGFVTDSSYSNIVFRKGKEWVTSSTPLLRGTLRQFMLDTHKLREEKIRAEDIRTFDTFKLINAMLRFEADEVSIDKIIF